VHIRDVIRGVIMGIEAEKEKIQGQVFNLGTDNGNYTKSDIVNFILKRMPETVVEYKDLTFGGDMRDITVSFEKINHVLGFDATLNIDDGVREVLFALKSGLIRNPTDDKYRNAQFIVQ
jgi:nucleoside-diphosphate-sugar epimerase